MEVHDHAILVVEDERPLLEAVHLKLEKMGFEVVTARSVEQAEGYVRDGVKIDAIWLDHYLFGKETGLDFVAHLKSDEKTKHIPIFVVSNTASQEKQQSYMRLGAVKYYVKSDHRLDAIIGDIKSFLANPDHE